MNKIGLDPTNEKTLTIVRAFLALINILKTAGSIANEKPSVCYSEETMSMLNIV